MVHPLSVPTTSIWSSEEIQTYHRCKERAEQIHKKMEEAVTQLFHSPSFVERYSPFGSEQIKAKKLVSLVPRPSLQEIKKNVLPYLLGEHQNISKEMAETITNALNAIIELKDIDYADYCMIVEFIIAYTTFLLKHENQCRSTELNERLTKTRFAQNRSSIESFDTLFNDLDFYKTQLDDQFLQEPLTSFGDYIQFFRSFDSAILIVGATLSEGKIGNKSSSKSSYSADKLVKENKRLVESFFCEMGIDSKTKERIDDSVVFTKRFTESTTQQDKYKIALEIINYSKAKGPETLLPLPDRLELYYFLSNESEVSSHKYKHQTLELCEAIKEFQIKKPDSSESSVLCKIT